MSDKEHLMVSSDNNRENKVGATENCKIKPEDTSGTSGQVLPKADDNDKEGLTVKSKETDNSLKTASGSEAEVASVSRKPVSDQTSAELKQASDSLTGRVASSCDVRTNAKSKDSSSLAAPDENKGCESDSRTSLHDSEAVSVGHIPKLRLTTPKPMKWVDSVVKNIETLLSFIKN